MKKLLLILTLSFSLCTFSFSQEYADFEITGTNEGTGTFANAALSTFSWEAIGAINALQLPDDEVFDNGNTFENTFGQADYAENIRIQNYPNGEGMAGYPVVSISQLTLNFEETTPVNSWGFCLVDIDVENCIISAIDEYDNEVPLEDIDRWLIELFDANNVEFGVNIPKWDASHAALLGSDTPEDYLVYDNLVIGGLDDSEAAAAFFMPDIPLKSLSIVYENLQETYFTSYHFYIASLGPTRINDPVDVELAIYPNPAKDYLNIKCSQLANNSALITIIDMAGKELIESQFMLGSDSRKVDISSLHSGFYFCRININDQIITKKIIKQ